MKTLKKGLYEWVENPRLNLPYTYFNFITENGSVMTGLYGEEDEGDWYITYLDIQHEQRLGYSSYTNNFPFGRLILINTSVVLDDETYNMITEYLKPYTEYLPTVKNTIVYDGKDIATIINGSIIKDNVSYNSLTLKTKDNKLIDDIKITVTTT